MAPDWVLPSASGLWNGMAAGCEWIPRRERALRSSSQLRGPLFRLAIPGGMETAPWKRRLSMPGKTVLVVDDDTGFRENLAGILNQFGYHALEAANGREALDAIERLPNGIDLMIVDLALPEVSGPEIIGAVARRKTAIKIIATSGVFDGAYLEMMKTVGADEAIHKTVLRHPEKWLEVINRLLGEEGEAAGRPSQRVVLLVDDEASVLSYGRRG